MLTVSCGLRGDNEMAANDINSGEPGYSIGVASRLTGIRPATLRIWERRYGLVKPGRPEGKTRVYSEDDVRRLSLIKSLVDAGHPISSVATMTIEQLRSRLETASGYLMRLGQGGSRPPRVVVLGHSLPELLTSKDHADVAQCIGIVGNFSDEEALRQRGSALKPDVLVVELDTIHRDTLGNIRNLLGTTGAARAVIIYGFAASQDLEDLATGGITCLRAPIALAGLASVVRSADNTARANIAAESSEPIPPRRYTPAQLARISSRSTSIACECPHHLVDLINSLAAFETYSRECENKSPEDAQIHAYLNAVTARSRAMMEAALGRVTQFEGIDVS